MPPRHVLTTPNSAKHPGLMYTWGGGDKGQLGHGDETSQNTPMVVEALRGKRVSRVSCGMHHTMVCPPPQAPAARTRCPSRHAEATLFTPELLRRRARQHAPSRGRRAPRDPSPYVPGQEATSRHAGTGGGVGVGLLGPPARVVERPPVIPVPACPDSGGTARPLRGSAGEWRCRTWAVLVPSRRTVPEQLWRGGLGLRPTARVRPHSFHSMGRARGWCHV